MEASLRQALEGLVEDRAPAQMEEAGPLTPEAVALRIQSGVGAALKNASLHVRVVTLMVSQVVIVDVFAAPQSAADLSKLNAAHSARFAISSWKDGVPVSVGGFGETAPIGDKVEVVQNRNHDAPKFRKRTTTTAKAADLVVAWLKDNAELFSPKGGWAPDPHHMGNFVPMGFESRAPAAGPEPGDDFTTWGRILG
jgi:hypothetical protein